MESGRCRGTKRGCIADGAAFDLVRASVNLVLAGLLIALGTSLKLPLSTTYVTFMVAMGTSLADRAWGRDSAVYRITGVLSVIGGWFITAGAAFTICFFVALVLHYGGNISIIALIGIAVFILIRSQVMYKKRKAKEQGNETLKQLMQTTDSTEALQLMRKHTREELSKVLEYAETNFELTVTSFLHENLRGLRRAMGSTKFEKQLIKQMIHPTTSCHLSVIGNSHLGGNMPIMLIVELSDHHRIGNYNAGSIGTGAEKPQWMSGFNNQCLFLGKFFQILLNQSILHPILANLPGFTISNKFVGI